MTKINLLPWREKAKAERLKQFYFLLGFGAGVGIIIIGIWFTILSSTISTQNDRNSYLSKEIAALDVRLGEVKNSKRKNRTLLTVLTSSSLFRKSAQARFVSLTSLLMRCHKVFS
jgi:type IV pilus assembly protein PilN